MMIVLVSLIVFNTIANENEENKKLYLNKFTEEKQEFFISI